VISLQRGTRIAHLVQESDPVRDVMCSGGFCYDSRQ
jgi:hypothetical protein